MIVRSLLWCAKLLLGGWRGKGMRWSPVMRREQLSGVWMLSLRQPKRWASRSNAARSAAFCCVKACVGGARTVGERLATKTLSQKDGGRHPLHRTARGGDSRLHRRTGASSSPHLPPSAQLVCQWAPHQSVHG